MDNDTSGDITLVELPAYLALMEAWHRREMREEYGKLSNLKKDMVRRKLKKLERKAKHGKFTSEIPA